MKKLLRLSLLFSVCWFLNVSYSNAQIDATIFGPPELCLGECATYEVVLLDSTAFIEVADWTSNGGAIINSGTIVTICADDPNGIFLIVTGIAITQQGDTFDFETQIFIEVTTVANPIIISTSAACPDSLTTCDRICAFNSATYEATDVPPGMLVDWAVQGAENFTINGNSVTVDWGAPGQGEVTATVGGGSGTSEPLQIFCGMTQYTNNNPDLGTGEGYLNILGGTPPFEVVLTGPNQVMNFSTNDSLYFSLLETGTYLIEVTDVSGQMANCQFDIVGTDFECFITLNPVQILHATDCNTCDGYIEVEPVALALNSAFMVTWNNGLSSTLSQDGLCPGLYSIILEDDFGCKDTVSIEIACLDPTLSCSGESSLCVEILEEPKAMIASTPSAVNNVIEICQGQTVYFQNDSESAASYIWDFGDLNTSTQFEPNHTYPTPGNYTVSLIARNACFCSDTTFVEINVLAADVAEINCVGTVCEGNSVTYSTDVSCGTYNWSIIGAGTVLDGGGPVDNFITVEWTAGPEGFVSLDVSGCAGNVCNIPNVVPIPIVSDAVQILGRDKVCEGSTEEYHIPNYQGTEITWSVNGSGNIVGGQGSERVTINWYGNANMNNPQRVIVEFNNCYLGCEGRDTLEVDIVPSFYLKGPIEVCENSSADYRSFNSITDLPINSNWELIDTAGTVVWTGGPAPGVSIDWNFTPGSYTVHAEAANPANFCNDDYDIFVKLTEAPQPVTSIDGTVEICPGQTYSYTANGLPLHDFSWAFVGGTPSTSNGDPANVTWGPVPPYEVMVTQTSTIGQACTSDPISLTINEIPAYQVTGNDEVCLEETGMYSAPVFENVDYSWSISPADRGTIVNGQGTENIEVVWHSAGPATVSLGICAAIENINVDVLPLPDPQVIHPNEICKNELAAVSTTAPFVSYEWLDENGLLVSTLPNPDLPAGFYNLTVVDQDGCAGSTSFDIFELPLPAVTISVPIYVGLCPGGPSVTITASTTEDGYDFAWTANGVPAGVNSPYFPTDSIGTYSVIVTDQNGCTNSSNTLLIADCASAGGSCNNGVCGAGGGTIPGSCNAGGTISFEIQNTADCPTHNFINTSTNDVPGSWNWNFGDPGSGANNLSIAENPSHTFSGLGYYPILFLGLVPDLDNPGGTCLAGQLQQDTILTAADFDFETACPGIPIPFTDISEKMPFATITGWGWDFDDPASGPLNTSTDQHPSHVFQLPGTYSVSLTITEASGCAVTVSKDVTIFDPPMVDFLVPAQTCENTALPFSANVSADAIDVLWNFGDPSSGDANGSANLDTYHEFDAPGAYTVSVTATNIFGCSTTFSEIVMVEPNMLGGDIAFSQPSPICEGDNVTLTAPPGGINYVWSTNDQVNQITTSTSGVYDVTLTDAEGCTYSPADAVVDVFGEPNGIIKAVEYNEFGQPVAFFENNYTVCEGEDVNLVIQGSLDYSYVWSNGEGGDEIAFTEERDNLLDVGTYDFTVTVTDNTTGCTSEEGPFNIIVNPKPDVQISSIPSGFLCENNTATLLVDTPDPNNIYSWNTGESGTSIMVIAGGTYFAQAVNQFGCKSRSNEVVVNNAPDIDNIPTGCHTRCAPDTMCLPNMPLVSSFQWFFNNTPLAAPNGTLAEPVFDQSGEYYVEMVDIYGCKSVSDMLNIDLVPGFGDIFGNVYFDVNENGIIDGPDTLVSGIDIILTDGTVNLDTVTSGLGAYIFNNILANGYVVVLDTANLPNNWQAYFVDTNIDIVGCDVEEQFDWLLTNACLPETNNENFVACEGDGILYNGVFIPAGEIDTLVFTSVDGCDSTIIVTVNAIPVDTTQLELGACTGTTVSYNGVDLDPGDQQDFTLADQDGCDSVVQVTVVEWFASSENMQLTACENSFIDFNGTQLFPGDQQDFTFATVNGCDSIVSVTVMAASVDSTTVALQVCGGESIDYDGQQLFEGDDIIVVKTNQFGCDSVIEVSVSKYPEVTFDVLAGEICWNGTDGQIEVQNLQGGTAPYFISLDGQNFQTGLVFDQLDPGAYTIHVQDDNDCQFEEPVAIPVIPPIAVEIEDRMMECGDVIELSPIVVSELPVTWQWSDGSSDSSISVSAPGVYSFSITNDCEMVVQDVTVSLEAVGLEGRIYMPNSFSPNNDGTNDCYQGFVAPGLDVEFYSLKIFDRWGDMMFETNNLDGCWDGNFKNKPMDPAVFAWFMELRIRNCDGNLLEIFEEGGIHLVR